MVAFLPPLSSAELPLEPGHRVSIACASHPELAGQWTVLKDGTLHIRSFGRLRAAGRTVTQFREALLRQLVISGAAPDLSISAKGGPESLIRVDGSVGRALQLPVRREGWTLRQALAWATPTETAPRVRIESLSAPTMEVAAEAPDVRLWPGDRVMVLEAGTQDRVTMTGAVQVPGAFQLPPDATLESVLQLGKGLTAIADTSKLLLTRGQDSIPLIWPEDRGFRVRGGDAVWVAPQADQGVVLMRGKIKREGYVKLYKGCTLLSAIRDMGGVSGDGDRLQVVIRVSKGKDSRTFTLSYSFLRDGRIPDVGLEPSMTIELVELSKG